PPASRERDPTTRRMRRHLARRCMQGGDVAAQIQQLESTAAAELREVKDAAGLEQYRIKYLGANGQLKAAMKWLGQVPREEKPLVGQQLNDAKQSITAAFQSRESEIAAGGAPAKDAIDVTEPGLRPQIGARHLLM